MKVESWYGPGKQSWNTLKQWRHDVVDVCCQDMKNALDDKFVDYGDYDGMLNAINSVCIYHCSPYPEGASWDEMPISYCPFCGEEIIVVTKSDKNDT